MAMPRKKEPLICCKNCGKVLERKRHPSGALECYALFLKRKYCNRKCFGMSLRKTFSSGNPSSARTMARSRKAKGICEKCGKADGRDVHHINGNPQDNRQKNLMRICRSCHNKTHRTKGSCVICGKPQKGHGYCNKHYIRFKKYGNPMAYKIPPRKKCKECGKPAHGKSLCGKHYMQAKRKGLLV